MDKALLFTLLAFAFMVLAACQAISCFRRAWRQFWDEGIWVNRP